MSYEIKKLDKKDWPPLLKEINDPPKQLYYAGRVPDYNRKFLCVVGSRKYTPYGKDIVSTLISGLEGFPVTIVSGLALGIDAIAHRAAIKNKLGVIAVPGSGLDPKAMHPKTNIQLAEEIINEGGTLISEFEPDFKATLWSFPLRNRIMAGMSHAVLVVEAETKSGTLITAKLATGYNREVLAVPGSIFSPTSDGPHLLIKLGATPVRNSEDILEALGIGKLDFLSMPSGSVLNKSLESKGNGNSKYSDCSERELLIISLLQKPLEKDLLLREALKNHISVSETQTLLTLLELKGHIIEKLGELKLT